MMDRLPDKAKEAWIAELTEIKAKMQGLCEMARRHYGEGSRVYIKGVECYKAVVLLREDIKKKFGEDKKSNTG